MTNKKKLVIEIDEELHFIVKRRALNKRKTLKSWIIEAIANLIREEDELEKKNE